MSKTDEKNDLAVAEAPTVLSAKDKQEAEKRYKEKIDYFDKLETGAIRSVLMNCWEKGQFVDELLKEGKKYGNRTVENFATDLKRREMQALGKPQDEIDKIHVVGDTMHAYHRFFLRYDKKAVEEAVQKRIPWRAVHLLLSIDNDKTREQLQQKYVNNKDSADPNKRITTDDLADMVKEVNKSVREKMAKKGEKTDGRGGVAPTTHIRSSIAMSDDYGKKLDEAQDALREFKRMPDGERKSDMAIRVKDLKKALKVVSEKIEKVLKVAED